MSILNSNARNQLSTHDFAIPETRSYPIHDEAHARNALARVSQFGTPQEQARVRAAVHRRFPGIGAGQPKTSGRRVSALSNQAEHGRVDSSQGKHKSLGHRLLAPSYARSKG